MKKILIFTLLVFSASSLYSEDAVFLKSSGKSDKKVSLDKIDKNLEGKAKLGLSLGYLTGLTFGYQMTEELEINTVLGFSDFDTFSLSINTLIAFFDIEGGETVFPVTAGPALYIHAGNNVKIDILGIIRIEHDFNDIPLNLFLEGGAGLRLTPDIKFTGSGALGIRYIF